MSTTEKSKPVSDSVRFYCSTIPWFVLIRELEELAKNNNVKVQVTQGKRLNPSYRPAFFRTETVEENQKFQKLVQEWISENYFDLLAKGYARRSEAAAEQAKLKKDAVAAGEPEKAPQPKAVKLNFVHLEKKAKDAKEAKDASKDAKAAKDSKDSKESKESKDSKDAKEAGEASKEVKEAKNATKKDEKKRARKTRPPTKRVPRDDAVYVHISSKTTVDELRALLPNFDEVTIDVRRQRRQNSRGNSTVGAIITVGKDNQQKALDALEGKELDGVKLAPKQSYTVVPLNPGETDAPAVGEGTSEHVE